MVHCFWTFESMDEAHDVPGRGASATSDATVAASLKRPRLSYNVAVYHRAFGGAA